MGLRMKRSISEDAQAIHTRSEPQVHDPALAENDQIGPKERRRTTHQLLEPGMTMNLVPEATQESILPTENEPGKPVFLPTEQEQQDE